MFWNRRLRHFLGFFVAAVLGLALTAAQGSARRQSEQPGPWCGGPLWRLLTLSDRDRGRVALRPRDTSIADLAALQPPPRIVARRTDDFQRHVWRLEVVVDRYRIGTDGEIALVLYSIPSGQYMNAYLANPACLSRTTRDRDKIAAARAAFTGHCPRVSPGWQLLGASVKIAGVGYWNPVRTTRGALSNGAELRPVTDLQIVAGCGAP